MQSVLCLWCHQLQLDRVVEGHSPWLAWREGSQTGRKRKNPRGRRKTVRMKGSGKMMGKIRQRFPGLGNAGTRLSPWSFRAATPRCGNYQCPRVRRSNILQKHLKMINISQSTCFCSWFPTLLSFLCSLEQKRGWLPGGSQSPEVVDNTTKPRAGSRSAWVAVRRQSDIKAGQSKQVVTILWGLQWVFSIFHF